MRSLRGALAAALRSAIETHLGLIENLEKEADENDVIDAMVEGKITYLSASQPALARRTREDRERTPADEECCAGESAESSGSA